MTEVGLAVGTEARRWNTGKDFAVPVTLLRRLSSLDGLGGAGHDVGGLQNFKFHSMFDLAVEHDAAFLGPW